MMRKYLYSFFMFAFCAPHILLGMEGQNSFTSLPDHLLKEIAGHCDSIDRCALRCTCRQINGLLHENQQQDAQSVLIKKLTNRFNGMASLYDRKDLTEHIMFMVSSWCFWLFFLLYSPAIRLMSHNTSDALFSHMNTGFSLGLIGIPLSWLGCVVSMLVFKYQHPRQRYDYRLDRTMATINDPALQKSIQHFRESLDSHQYVYMNEDVRKVFDVYCLIFLTLPHAATELIARLVLGHQREHRKMYEGSASYSPF